MTLETTKRLIRIAALFVLLSIARYSHCVVTQYKDTSSDVVRSSSSSNSIRILSLGGSITYGSKLESRQKSYPYGIFKGALVANVAMRATGPEYSSKCIQSMVDEELRGLMGQLHVDSFEFDVITIEYSLNGLTDIDLLLARLQMRYPSALFVYVHFVSPRMAVRNDKTGLRPKDIMEEPGLTFQERDQLMMEALSDSGTNWVWDDESMRQSTQAKNRAIQEIQKVGGIIWDFPLDDDPRNMFHLFANDHHHLNENGHDVVAKGLRDVILQQGLVAAEGPPGGSSPPAKKRDSKKYLKGMPPPTFDQSTSLWGKGDLCFSWYQDGNSPLDHSGGVLRRFVKPDKFAHEISRRNGTATISFDNKFSWPMPLSVSHMVWRENMYPQTQVHVRSNQEEGMVGTASSNTFSISPLHPIESMRAWHVSTTTRIGYANPGRNEIVFECLEETVKPFRITAIILCGACE